MTDLTIDPQHAADLYDLEQLANDTPGEFGPWAYVGTQHVRNTRWEEVHWLVVREAHTGDLYGPEYRIGLTEDQSNDLPWDDGDDPLPLTRLYAHEVTRVEYSTKPLAVTP